MRKGFTLVELLVVVVVLVTLMSITFRLSSIGAGNESRSQTIARMNRLENCLSGYYAAFGTYPPVAVHGSRNIYATVSDHGIQSDTEENRQIWNWTKIGDAEEKKAWEQVKAACKAQPVDCRFPFPDSDEYRALVETVSSMLQVKANESGSGLSEARKNVLSNPFSTGLANLGRFDAEQTDWRRIQLFKFGLMSYLLPRYLVMMNSREELYQNGNFAQWDVNNELPCNPLTGYRFSGWQVVRNMAQSENSSDLAAVANIPSQAVTARWMPNLGGIVCCNHDFKLFGVNIRGDRGASELRSDNTEIEVYSPGGYEDDSTSGQYVLDSATVLDGWYREFYYYSAPPYQSYTLWSAGPNGRTFPPWISRKNMTDASANKCIGLWVEDDIVRMSN